MCPLSPSQGLLGEGAAVHCVVAPLIARVGKGAPKVKTDIYAYVYNIYVYIYIDG